MFPATALVEDTAIATAQFIAPILLTVMRRSRSTDDVQVAARAAVQESFTAARTPPAAPAAPIGDTDAE